MMILKIKKSEMTRKMRARAVRPIKEGQESGRGEQFGGNNMEFDRQEKVTDVGVRDVLSNFAYQETVLLAGESF